MYSSLPSFLKRSKGESGAQRLHPGDCKENQMANTPEDTERDGGPHADTPDNRPEDDTMRPEQGRAEESQGRGHGPLKGTDTLATTDVAYIDRERGKRTTM